jgi:putative GTP pyrophosphokinase
MKNNTTEHEFVELYRKERPVYEAWGKYLENYILSVLNSHYINLDKILKIPISCRSKEVESLVAKAFYRNKAYSDPYKEITDKVGIRFVVMTESQVDIISNIIESCKNWLEYSKDVDYNVFRDIHPEVFTYQSRHYVVKNKNQITYEGHIIEIDTPCEIQIRTLEQHAYAEVSHELFYKKDDKQVGKALRLLARTAAFNEESDYLFGRMYKMIESRDDFYNNFMKILKDKYKFSWESDKLNRAIYDDVYELIEKYNVNADLMIQYIEANSYIMALIKEKQTDILFNQPIIIVLYYLLGMHKYELCNIWQYPEEMLDSIKADLGIATD